MASRKQRGLVAAGTGAALAASLFSTGTFALWQDSVTMDGGTITAGNLDVAALGTTTWKDVSSDTEPTGGTVINDINAYRIVPGDTIQKSQDLDVALEGDNMTATLGLSNAALTGILGDGTAQDVDETETGGTQDVQSTKGVTITYTVTKGGVVATDASGNKVENIPAGTNTTLNLKPTDVTPALDGKSDYNVTVNATFDKDTPERTRVQAQTELQQMGITLQQTRPETPAA